MLEVRGLAKRFGGTAALSGVTFTVPAGAIFGVIGPNGAGKTTLFNVLTGFVRPDQGSASMDGVELLGRTPEEICGSGVCRTFQVTRPFPNLTVLDNVIVAALAHAPTVGTARQQALDLMDFLGIVDLRTMLGRSLNIGQRKRLELARALATQPKLLLLDEVMGGLNPTEVNQALTLLRRINAQGVTLIVIEHIMAAITSLCSRVLVLHHGEPIAEGTAGEVANDRRVIGAYLGEEFLVARG
jgi:branched-chain amino acid transport system ATP-binding protein